MTCWSVKELEMGAGSATAAHERMAAMLAVMLESLSTPCAPAQPLAGPVGS